MHVSSLWKLIARQNVLWILIVQPGCLSLVSQLSKLDNRCSPLFYSSWYFKWMRHFGLFKSETLFVFLILWCICVSKLAKFHPIQAFIVFSLHRMTSSKALDAQCQNMAIISKRPSFSFNLINICQKINLKTNFAPKQISISNILLQTLDISK